MYGLYGRRDARYGASQAGPTMTTDAQRSAIQAMIRRHTASATTDRNTARESLIKEGVYTRAGNLTADFGGKKTASR